MMIKTKDVTSLQWERSGGPEGEGEGGSVRAVDYPPADIYEQPTTLVKLLVLLNATRRSG